MDLTRLTIREIALKLATVGYGDESYFNEHVAELERRLSRLAPAGPLPHDLYKTGDRDAPDVIKDGNGEVVLNMCRRCRNAESELSDPYCTAPSLSPTPPPA